MFLSSAGHVADMIARMKNNRAQLKKKGYYSKVENHLPKEKLKNLQFRKASSQEKQIFLSKHRKSTKKERITELFFLLSAVILFIIGFFLVLKHIA